MIGNNIPQEMVLIPILLPIVRKGLVLGCHLFLTYVSGLIGAIKYSQVHHFANDSSLINKQANDNFKVNS